MKIGFLCDAHMPANSISAQRHFCTLAAEQFARDGIRTVITLGDITSYGEPEALEDYLSIMNGFDHFWVLGNSDVRNPDTAGYITGRAKSFHLQLEGQNFLGIHTPYARLEQEDMAALEALADGDFVVLHHPPQRLFDPDSRTFFEDLCARKRLTIFCGHLHRTLSGQMGQSRYFGLRAIDPDKAFLDWPCVTYYDTLSDTLTEVHLSLTPEALRVPAQRFGISCVDNHRDVAYAAERKLYAIELRCNGKTWEPDMTLLPLLEKWRKVGGKYLSIHMPNLRWEDGQLSGLEKWKQAVAYANAIGADGMTIHPPRMWLRDLKDALEPMLAQYIYLVENVPCSVNIGIENLHMNSTDTSTDRHFGYTPEEVSFWIDRINQATRRSNPVGHTLDVGHARNNGYLASRYPISRWYELMGSRVTAFHIHQVIQQEKALKNHNAIEDWFGPQINYTSFFYHMQKGTFGPVPVFLEVKGSENTEKSLRALEQLCARLNG